MSAVENYFKSSSSKIEKVEGKYIFIQGRKYLDFSSTNFLGLKNDERIKSAAKEAIDIYGIDVDSNKTFSKHGETYLKLREKMNKLKNQEETILYNAGYNVSAGIIPNLVGENDVIFSDSQNFIDIYQGIYKSKAHLIRYKHNDINNLESKIIKYREKFKKALVITDTVFFTDGTEAKLKEIIDLKQLHDFILMVDDSNGDGIYGENGRGIAGKANLSENIDLVIGDFSRNYGGLGEYVSGKEKFVNILLKNSLSRTMVYKVLISPLASMISNKAIEISEKETERRETVLDLSNYLRKELKNRNLNTANTSTHIVPIIFDKNEIAIKFSKFLYKNGIVASTTVGKTTIEPRVKFYINSMLDKDDIEALIFAVSDFIETSEMTLSSPEKEVKEETAEVESKVEEKKEEEKVAEVKEEVTEESKEVEETKETEEVVKAEEVEESEPVDEIIETEQEVISMDDIFDANTSVEPEKKEEVSSEDVDIEDTEEFKKSKEDAFSNAEELLDLLED